MQKRDPKNWLSFHFFVPEPHTDFLLTQIYPLVSDLYDEQLILQFFYIRYAENGPHIRLRMLCENQDQINQVMEYVSNKFKDTFELDAALQEDGNYPTNSIQLIEYEREVDRYGPNRIDLIEDHFCVASEFSLSMLNETADVYNDENSLGFLLQMQTYFVHGLGMDDEETLLFLETAFEAYLNSMMEKGEEDEENKANAIAEYNASYEKSKEGIHHVFGQIWNMLNDEDVDKSNHDFYCHALQMTETIEEQYANGLLNWREKPSFIQGLEHLTEAQRMTWSNYVDLYHLLNNRMGFLQPENEAYLLYVLKESLKVVVESTS